MKKYRYTFDFVDTETQAIKLCDSINKKLTRYMRKKHPAHFTPWNSLDNTEHKFVVWYYY